MKIFDAVKKLTKFETALWLSSLAFIAVTYSFGGSFNIAVLTASLLGATALIFVSKGEPLGQLLTIVFAVVYSIVSLQFRYYGEMITYMFMTAPSAAAALISWLRHPHREGETEVKINDISARLLWLMVLLTAAVTAIFYFILKYFDTPNLLFSTVSIATSFAASYLTFFRSPYYALAYSANDVVLIILWVLASMSDSGYIPMIACFFIFLANDLYGFINWRRIKNRQRSN